MKKLLLSLIAFFTLTYSYAQWAQVNNGLSQNLSQGTVFISSHNGNMFTGTYTGFKLYKSSDFGNNWNEINTPVFSGVPVSTLSYGNRLFFGLDLAWDDVYYTDDDGATWQVVTGGPQSTVVRGFYELSGNLYCYTSNQGVYRSIDGGINWAQFNNGLTVLNVVKLESIGSRLLACTINGGVYVSDDFGNTWIQSNNGISSSHLAGNQLWREGSMLYYLDQSSGVYSSADQGSSWIAITKPVFWGQRPVLVYRNAISNNLYMKNRFAIGNDSLYVTSDEGVTWTNITANLPQNFNQAVMTESNGYVFYAYDILAPNLGVYRYGNFNGVKEKEMFNLSVYPNPTSSLLNVEFSEKINSVRILDSFGRVVLTAEINSTNSCKLNISSLHSGVYFLQLTDDNIVNFTKRVIIMD